jgi:hypothetical protein
VYTGVAETEEESSSVYSGVADLQLQKVRKSVALCIQVWLTYSYRRGGRVYRYVFGCG